METSNCRFHGDFSISDLANLLGVTRPTIHRKLREDYLLRKEYQCGNKFIIPAAEAEKFIANHYPRAYYTLYNHNRDIDKGAIRASSVDSVKRSGVMMFNIPKGKGAINVKKLKDGSLRYYIRNLPLYYDEHGEIVYYKGQGFDKKREAENMRNFIVRKRENGEYKLAYLQELENRVKTPKENPLAEQSYYQYCVDFFKMKKIEEKTRKDYLQIVETKIKPFFRETAIKDLSRAKLQECLDSYTTVIDKTFTVVKQTIGQLFCDELISEDFSLRLNKPKATMKRRAKSALTIEERDKFLAYFKGHWLEHVMYLMFYTGMRVGECVALQWQEVEIVSDDIAWIHINASMGETQNGIGRKKTKTESSTRCVPINNKYVVALLKNARDKSHSKWVAANKHGSLPILSENLSKRYFTTVAQKIGLPKRVTSHTARHTFISLLCQTNLPKEDIAKLVGHETTEMIIKRYAHSLATENQLLKLVSGL